MLKKRRSTIELITDSVLEKAHTTQRIMDYLAAPQVRPPPTPNPGPRTDLGRAHADPASRAYLVTLAGAKIVDDMRTLSDMSREIEKPTNRTLRGNSLLNLVK